MKSLLAMLFAKSIETTVFAEKPVIEWIDIPKGTFFMGSPVKEAGRDENELQHEVTVNAFMMSKYEITFEQYDNFCEADGREFPFDDSWGRGKRPVIGITWYDAIAFADWMGCRLPTDEEWEYAARAGTTTPFYTGDCLSTDQANYNGHYPYNNCGKGKDRRKTMPVGRFAANAWGLHDMLGNVWEWCRNLEDDPVEPEKIPGLIYFDDPRAIRGGSWDSSAMDCRSSRRNDADPTKHFRNIGFRLVSMK